MRIDTINSLNEPRYLNVSNLTNCSNAVSVFYNCQFDPRRNSIEECENSEIYESNKLTLK